MKNVFKALGNLNRARNAKVPLLIIALLAVIGFSFAVLSLTGCGGGDDGGGSYNIVSGADVFYSFFDETETTEAKKATDFSYYDYNERSVHISAFLDGSSSVTVNNNKLTIILGTPISAFLQSSGVFILEGLTATPSNAKYFFLPWFWTSDRMYTLYCAKDYEDDGDVDNAACLIYVDRDLTINGTRYNDDSREYTVENWIVSLKKGWNYIIYSYNNETDTVTVTSSTSQPGGYKWTVFGRHRFFYY